jgi:hypothetical protein
VASRKPESQHYICHDWIPEEGTDPWIKEEYCTGITLFCEQCGVMAAATAAATTAATVQNEIKYEDLNGIESVSCT